MLIKTNKEHTSNKRKSNLNKHQEGQARKARDAGGEKMQEELQERTRENEY